MKKGRCSGRETMAEYFHSDLRRGAAHRVGSYINMTGFHWAF